MRKKEGRRADNFQELTDQQRSAFLTENIRGGAQDILNCRQGREQGKTIRPRRIFKVKAAIKLADRSATSKHQTLTFLVFVSADKHEESTETALEAVYKADVDAAVQMEAPGSDYAGAAMKAIIIIIIIIIMYSTSSCFENTYYCVLKPLTHWRYLGSCVPKGSWLIGNQCIYPIYDEGGIFIINTPVGSKTKPRTLSR